MLIARLKCTACGTEYPAGQLMNLAGGRSYDQVIMDLDFAAEQPDLAGTTARRVWRRRPLPLDIANADDRRHIMTLGGAVRRCSTTAIIRWRTPGFGCG
jgi:hypothetical protein